MWLITNYNWKARVECDGVNSEMVGLNVGSMDLFFSNRRYWVELIVPRTGMIQKFLKASDLKTSLKWLPNMHRSVLS